MNERWTPTTDLLDGLLEGFQVIDRDFRYLYQNPAAARHGRTTPEAMIGRTMMECYPGFETTHIFGELARCMATNEPILVETEFPFDDGTVGIFEVRAEPVPEGIAILSLDITERRRAEARAKESETRLRERERLESLGRLAAGIAHDFNNLLSVMLGQGELALDRDGGPQPVDLEIVLDAARRSAALTRSFLAFGRRQMMLPEILDPRAVVADLETILRRSIGSDVALEFAIDADVGRIEIDPSKLEQVILNLVLNARDALPDGGRILVSITEHDALDETTGSSRHEVRLAVEDDGVGMTEAVRARVFEPFFTTKPRGEGTGLGLATVHGIVHQSHGRIWVESELGKGTRFVLAFPRVRNSAIDLDPPRPDSVRARRPGTDVPELAEPGGTILIAEDHAELRALAESAVQTAGFAVIATSNGTDALEVVRRDPTVRLLVTDVIMPGLRGPALIEQARALRPDLRFLCTSGYAADAIDRRDSLPRDVRFVEKPYLPSALVRAIRQVLAEP